MARIRAIKPEFWSSPGIGEASFSARLLYVAMWNWADDMGVGPANPGELRGFAFPNDDDMTLDVIRRDLDVIRRVFGVVFYEVGGRPFYSIPSWEKHQKFDRRSKGKYPGPDQADTAPDQHERRDSEGPADIPSSPRRDSVAGTGEQGNRGSNPIGHPADDRDTFSEFWESYPKRVAKQGAMKKFTTLTKTVDPDMIIAGAKTYAESMQGKDAKYIAHPTTWLNQGRWEDEITTPPSMNEEEARDRLRNPWKYQ